MPDADEQRLAGGDEARVEPKQPERPRASPGDLRDLRARASHRAATLHVQSCGQAESVSRMLRARIAGLTRISRPRLWFWIASVVLVPLTWHRVWQMPPFLPVNDFDGSWQAGLHMAAHQRLSFGGDVVFPYGPLGFLALPVLCFTSTAAISFAFVSLARVGLSALVLRAALRSFPWPLAGASYSGGEQCEHRLARRGRAIRHAGSGVVREVRGSLC